MNKTAFILCLLLAMWLREPKAAAAETFERVEPGRMLSFPRDHGSHPRYATEWWYFTGHLRTADERTFGFQLTFFRVGITAERRSLSNWESPSIFLGHFALTDDAAERFYHSERTARASFGRAGAAEETLSTWIGSWSARLNGERLELSASDEHASLKLRLSPSKPLILQGEEGYSRKGPAPGEASYYTSFTRLEGVGEISLDDFKSNVTSASVWMDHEITSANLNRDYQGWDWFAVQLDSGEELMLYRLRLKDGSAGPFSSATFVRRDGSAVKLQSTDFSAEPTGYWTSQATGAKYPIRWTLSIPTLRLELHLTPTVANQELVTEDSTGVTYWEGRALTSGTLNGYAVSGAAYQELVGYKGAVVFRP